jgi:hypothetical protein
MYVYDFLPFTSSIFLTDLCPSDLPLLFFFSPPSSFYYLSTYLHHHSVIAHRLSTVEKADVILVIEEGKVVEKGNFKQLIGMKDGTFARLHNSSNPSSSAYSSKHEKQAVLM